MKTLKSVQEQTFINFEHIIIDGDSTDGSQELIKSHNQSTTFISEKDEGVYYAMNKGIKLAKGDYLLFLNSGDCLYTKDTLQEAIKQLNNEDMVYGNLLLNDPTKPYIYYFPKVLSFNFLFYNFLGHPSTFIKRQLFEAHGYYDTTYKIVADWAFMVKVIAKENVQTKHIEDVISIFDMDGMSANPNNAEKILKERKEFLLENFPLFYTDYQNINKDKHELEKIKSSKGFKLLKALGVKKFQ